MKLTKYFFWLMLTLMVASCSKDDDEQMDISIKSIASVWRVTSTNNGNGWVSCDTNDFDAIIWLIFSEDGYCASFLKECPMSGNYSFINNTAIMSDTYYDIEIECKFTDVRKNTATATISTKDGKNINIKMYRYNYKKLMYKEPTKFLEGKWYLTNVKDRLRNDIEKGDYDATIIFNDNNATFTINGETTTTSFLRRSVYDLITNDGLFNIQSADYSDDIEVYVSREMRILTFRKQ